MTEFLRYPELKSVRWLALNKFLQSKCMIVYSKTDTNISATGPIIIHYEYKE